MNKLEPIAEIDPRFSSPHASATPWDEARHQLEVAEIDWLSTVRPDGRPHVTPLISVWVDGSPYFVTGPSERKAKNLEDNPRCVLTTGCNEIGEGLDIVVEGNAVRVIDGVTLQRVADAFTAKYSEPFHFKVKDGGFEGDGGTVLLFEIKWSKAMGFGKGETFSQTRWCHPKR